MLRTQDDHYVISREEIAVLRAGLFVAIYHADPAFAEDLQTISGFAVSDFEEALEAIDDATSPDDGNPNATDGYRKPLA